jgi:hypothetical protein
MAIDFSLDHLAEPIPITQLPYYRIDWNSPTVP